MYALAQKFVSISKGNFTCSFDAFRLRAALILVEIEQKLRKGWGLKIKTKKRKKKRSYFIMTKRELLFFLWSKLGGGALKFFLFVNIYPDRHTFVFTYITDVKGDRQGCIRT